MRMEWISLFKVMNIHMNDYGLSTMKQSWQRTTVIPRLQCISSQVQLGAMNLMDFV